MILSIYILITLAIVTVEIIFDHWRWKQSKPDKPISTILRAGLIALSGIIILLVTKDINYTLRALAVIVGTLFLTFDFALNVSRWKDLKAPYYRLYQKRFDKYKKSGYSEHQARKMSYSALTSWERIEFAIKIFSTKFFYHGEGKKKFSYDLIFSRIPPQGELLIKGITFYMAIYYYFN